MSKARSRRARERAYRAAVDARRADARTVLMRTKLRKQIGLTMRMPGYLNGQPIEKVSPPFDRTTLPVFIRER